MLQNHRPTLRKALLAATLVASVGTGIYQASRASAARAGLQLVKEQQVPLAQQAEQLTHERDALATNLALLRQDNQRLNQSTAGLLKLRGEVARLRASAQPESTLSPVQHDSKTPEWIMFQLQAEQNLWEGGKVLRIKHRMHLSPKQVARVEEHFRRRKQDCDVTHFPQYEADLEALFTPEQLKQYEQVKADLMHPSATYGAICAAANEVEDLGLRLSLSQEQRDKAFHALVRCREAYQRFTSSQQAEVATDNVPVKPRSEEFLIKGEVEALKDVLTAEQFAIYQTYGDEKVKAERLRLAEP